VTASDRGLAAALDRIRRTPLAELGRTPHVTAVVRRRIVDTLPAVPKLEVAAFNSSI
jgi:hypothetical protein